MSEHVLPRLTGNPSLLLLPKWQLLASVNIKVGKQSDTAIHASPVQIDGRMQFEDIVFSLLSTSTFLHSAPVLLAEFEFFFF